MRKIGWLKGILEPSASVINLLIFRVSCGLPVLFFLTVHLFLNAFPLYGLGSAPHGFLLPKRKISPEKTQSHYFLYFLFESSNFRIVH